MDITHMDTIHIAITDRILTMATTGPIMGTAGIAITATIVTTTIIGTK